LSTFVFFVAIPALLFRAMAKGLPAGGLEWGILGAYYLGTAALFAAGIGVGRRVFGLGWEAALLTGMGAAFSNVVMIGLPLAYTAFGDEGLVALTLIVVFHSTLLIGGTTVGIEAVRGQGGGVLPFLRSAGLAVLQNPVIVGLLAGIAWSFTGLEVAVPLDRLLALLGQAAAPCALFALGASLAGHRLVGGLGESLVTSTLKLLVHPLAVWLLARFVFGLSPLWTAVATMAAALPTGANLFVLAQRYDVHVARSSAVVLLSTAFGTLTVGLLVYLLAP